MMRSLMLPLRICFCSLLLMVSIPLCAQVPRELYGSFVAGCDVFNYHFKQDANQIYSFSISELGNPNKRWDVKQDKLNFTLENLSELIKLDKPDHLSDSVWKAAIVNFKIVHNMLEIIK